MRRQLDEDGERRLQEWIDLNKPDDETHGRITAVLKAFAGDDRQLCFYYEDDPADRRTKVIMPEPQGRLLVVVRAWSAEFFTLIRIVDLRSHPDSAKDGPE